MTLDTTLDQLFHRVVTFPGPSIKLSGLTVALATVEEQLAHAKSQHEIRLKAKLKQRAKFMHPDDIEMEEYDVEKVVDELLPKILLGGFVIALWSVFESCVKDMAEHTRRHKNIPFGLQDLRAGDFIEQMEKFFTGAIEIRAFPDKTMRKQIEELKGIRNTLAHHDGNTKELPKSLRGKDRHYYNAQGLHVYRDLHHEYIVPNIEYTRKSLRLVTECLESFANELYTKLHPENAQKRNT